MDSYELLITEPEHRVIGAHYERAGVLLERHFRGTPAVTMTYPHGLAEMGVFHKNLPEDKVAPAPLETVTVRTSSGEHRYLALSAASVQWLVRARYSVEFQGWSPMPEDPRRAAYGRILLHPGGRSEPGQVLSAAREMIYALQRRGVGAIPLFDGGLGMALWIPFDDGPSYKVLAPWLNAFVHEVARARPNLLTVETFAHDRSDRVHVGILSNHPGMSSLLPYSLRGTPELEVVVPCALEDFESRDASPVTAASFGAFLDTHGDLFGTLRGEIAEQRFAGLEVPMAARQHRIFDFDLDLMPYDPHACIINAAIDILADGKAHSAADILAQAIARGLVPKTTSRKYLYVSLHGYVLRTLGAGRVPQFVQVPGTSDFRLNRPADDWPDVPMPARRRWISDVDTAAISKLLRSTAVGGDPAAFERAACDAFALLGFIAKHVGGNGEPDGVLTAPLATESYRVVLECKTAAPDGNVTNPRPEEAAKFRAGAGAQYSILLGPAFARTASFEDELKTHAIALWTVNDLLYAVEQQIGPDALREALSPGYAERPLQLIAWERDHGRPKRVAVIAEMILRRGWQTQVRLADGVPPAEMPAITEETLFVLADDALMSAGVATGATRAEAEDALRLLVAGGDVRRVESGYVVEEPHLE